MKNILGCPWLEEGQKLNTFKDLQENITKRVLGWKENYISKARREVLIKTVAQAIPIYSISIFKILVALCNTINSSLEKYWWGQTKDEKKIHWINWKKLCTLADRGGMGFRDFQVFNLAMLAKQAWSLIHNTHSLFYHVYKSRYFPHCSFKDAEVGSNPSYGMSFLKVQNGRLGMGTVWKFRLKNGYPINHISQGRFSLTCL